MQAAQVSGITAEMNVTPMIDVLLVLIIVAIILLALEAKLVVQVPTEKSSGSPQPAIVLELDPTGGYAINGRRVPEVGLAARLRALFAKRPNTVLFVRASGQRPYQDVIHAIDLARSAGVGVIGYMP